MKLENYKDPKAFWNEVSPHLKKEEAKNSLALGLSYTFQAQPDDCLYQGALFDGDQLAGAIVCSQYRTNRNFVISPVIHPPHAETLFEEFQKSEIAVTGIIGELNTAKVYEALFKKIGKKAHTHMTQGIYRCEKVVLPNDSDKVTFRPANLEDVKQIGEWIESFHQEAVPHDPPVKGAELAEIKIKNSMIYVVEYDGDLVSMAAWSRDIGTSCSVNLVFTPNHYRKKGYGTIVTGKLTQHLLNNGKRETNLYTDMSNPTSNKIYQNIGYQFVCDSVHLGITE